MIFKVIATEKLMLVSEYEVEAETAEDAINKYCDDLAGSIEPINEYYRPTNVLEQEDVFIK